MRRILFAALLLAMTSHVHYARGQSGTIEASPQICTLTPGSQYCSTSVSWTSNNASNVCVWRIHPTLGPAINACSPTGFQHEYPWVDTSGRILELRHGSSNYNQSSLLGSVNLDAVHPAGSISASAGTCTIPYGESYCSIDISWTSNVDSNACVWRIHPTLGPANHACSPTGFQHEYPWVDTHGRTLELRYGSTSSYTQSYLLDSVSLSGVPHTPAKHSGGSNFGWFNIESSGCSSSNSASSRFNYTVVRNFHLDSYQNLGEWQGIPRSTIISRLQAMYNSGQRSLRIPVSHRHCGQLPTGTSESEYGGASCGTRFPGSATASDSGVLPGQAAKNIVDMLEVAKSIGFERVIVGFFPGGQNRPKEWDSINHSMLQENIGVIQDVVDRTLNSSGNTRSNLPKIMWDLSNEHIPASNQPNLNVMKSYGQMLWSWWRGNYSQLDSIGFTVIANSKWQVQNRFVYMPDIYGSDIPDAIAISLYSHNCTAGHYENNSLNCDRERVSLLEVDQKLSSMPGYEDVPIIIAESFFNDPHTALDVAEASSIINRDILFLLQWPTERGTSFNCFVSSTAPFIYKNFGF